MNLRRLMQRRKKDEELAEEIESHLAHEQDANAARGLSADEARRRARVRFGNPRATRERVWLDRSFPWIETLWRDLRFALRSLKKTPAFTVIAILVIAVGIGVNTAVFSVINTVLLKPLAYPDSQALVKLMNTSREGSFPGASIPKFNIWLQQKKIFQQVAAYDFVGAGMNLTGGDQPQQVQGIHVSAGYFALFGAPVTVGRTFTAAEDSPHGGNVVVLSYGLWKSRFGGNPNIVGSNIQLDGQPYLVVGVIGRGFVTDTPADLWVPYQFDLASQDMANYFTVAARLKPGMTIPQANAQLRLAADQYRRMYGVMSYSVQQRTQELGVRMALGAQTWNLRNMVIGQGMMLSGLGVVLGIGGAFAVTRFLASFLFGVKTWDPVAFIVAPLILCAVALIAVWIPARRATRVDPMTALRIE